MKSNKPRNYVKKSRGTKQRIKNKFPKGEKTKSNKVDKWDEMS